MKDRRVIHYCHVCRKELEEDEVKFLTVTYSAKHQMGNIELLTLCGDYCTITCLLKKLITTREVKELIGDDEDESEDKKVEENAEKKQEAINKKQEDKWAKCGDHEWEMSNFVIDTAPATYSWHCKKCGATTHDPKTGKPCSIKHYE